MKKGTKIGAWRASPRKIKPRDRDHLLDPLTCWDDFLALLRGVRRERGISQIEMDEKSGFCLGYTAKIEIGMRYPGPWLFDTCLQSFGIQFLPLPRDLDPYTVAAIVNLIAAAKKDG